MNTNYGPENIFSALSGMTSGGTNKPSSTTSATSGTPNSVVSQLPQQGGLPPNMGDPSQGIPYNRFQMGAGPQGNPTTPNSPTGGGMPPGGGLSGMFQDILGRMPGIMQMLQSKMGNVPANHPLQSLLQGMFKPGGQSGQQQPPLGPTFNQSSGQWTQ